MRALAGEHLDCHRQSIGPMRRLPDLAHAAAPDHMAKLKRPELNWILHRVFLPKGSKASSRAAPKALCFAGIPYPLRPKKHTNFPVFPANARRAAPPSYSLDAFASRSEEHTSELQSRPHLVCRLLLEKKKA